MGEPRRGERTVTEHASVYRLRTARQPIFCYLLSSGCRGHRAASRVLFTANTLPPTRNGGHASSNAAPPRRRRDAVGQHSCHPPRPNPQSPRTNTQASRHRRHRAWAGLPLLEVGAALALPPALLEAQAQGPRTELSPPERPTCSAREYRPQEAAQRRRSAAVEPAHRPHGVRRTHLPRQPCRRPRGPITHIYS